MNLAPVLRQKFFNTAGAPLAGGLLYSYIAGTTTPRSTFTDQTGSTPNTNPVVLDANGEANVWLDPTLAYKFILEDSLNNVLWTVDNVSLSYVIFSSLVRHVTSNDNALVTDGTIIATPTAPMTETLPTLASSLSAKITVVNRSAWLVTVKGNGAELINGANTYVDLINQGDSQTFYNADGTQWDLV